MPRKARLIVPGAIYHVMGRCLDQYRLFSDDTDREQFLSYLDKYLHQTQTCCYAWVLMDNHYHLVLRIGDIELWEIVKPVNMRYAQYHQGKTARRGPLFMDRFKSIATQDQNYAQELVRYVHLNPVRAGIVKGLKALEKFPWSGHAVLMGAARRNFQDVKTVLKIFGKNNADSRTAYCHYLLEGIKRDSDDSLIDLVRKSNSGLEAGRKVGCWVIGDPNFVSEAITSSAARRLRVSRFESEGRSFNAILVVLKKHFAITEELLKQRQRGGLHSEARKVFAWLASRIYRAPVSAIAEYLNVGLSAVSAMSRAGGAIATKRKIAI